MEEVSIKVTIAGRVYPLKIKKVDEDRILKAAGLLNDRIKEYEQQYAVTDKLDLVAMCAIQFASEFINVSEELENEKVALTNSVASVSSRISEFLSNKSVL